MKHNSNVRENVTVSVTFFLSMSLFKFEIAFCDIWIFLTLKGVGETSVLFCRKKSSCLFCPLCLGLGACVCYLFCNAVISVLFSFAINLPRKRDLSCGFYYSVYRPQGVLGWSVVCVCDIFWSY